MISITNPIDRIFLAVTSAAFTKWEEEYRANPEHFMDDAQQRARKPDDLGETRALYFADLIERVIKEQKGKQ